MKKFEKVYAVDDYEILSDTGFIPIKNVMKTIKYQKYVVIFDNGDIIECADEHLFIDIDGNEIYAKDCIFKDLKHKDGSVFVMAVLATDEYVNMYDIEMESGHKFYTNGVLSHNTTTVAGYLLHSAIFNKKYNIAILANKKPAAMEVLDRVKDMYECLPWWMQQGVTVWNKGDIKLGNGSKIFTAATKGSGIRGKSVNCPTGDGLVLIRDKETGEVKYMKIEDLYANA